MKKIVLVVGFLFLVVGSGWAVDIVGDTIQGNLNVVGNGALELTSTNDSFSFIDFKGKGNEEADYIGRIMYKDSLGFSFYSMDKVNFFINNNGNVGIGTTTPDTKLTVQGDMNIGGSAIGEIKVRHINGKDYQSSNHAGLYLQHGVNHNTLINTNSTGNVGIGTLSPDSKLTIEGDLNVGAYGIGQIKTRHINGKSYQNANIEELYIQHGVNHNTLINTNSTGNVGIGTLSPQSKLAVNGTITAKEVKVTNTGWADYVFEDDYKLKPLSEIESFVKENKHLPEVPSAEEIKKNGLSVAEMMEIQMKKIEELTLHLINHNEMITEQNKQNELQNKIIEDLQNELALLKK